MPNISSMKRYGLLLLFILSTGIDAASPNAKVLEWDALMPAGYLESLQVPESMARSATDGAPDAFNLDDDSIEAQAAFAELQEKYRSAPLVDKLDGEYIRLAGFVVPLEFNFDDGTFSEFLLVPYFGACIHVPPPPSNQIIYVKTDQTLNEDWLDYAVWVTGTLSTKSVDSEFGFAGYSMSDISLKIYEEEEDL